MRCFDSFNVHTKEMTESGAKPWWKSRRRLFSVAIITLAGILILATLTSKTVVRRRGSEGAAGGGYFRFFGRLGSHYLFPWNGDDAVEQNFAKYDSRYKGRKRLPHALVIGAKKAGTRALLEFIRIHPDVRAAGHEVHYFDKNFSKGPNWYKEMMPTSIDGQITIEKTPSYLVTEEAPKRVYSLDPGMKLIVVLKDPVERAISDFTQSLSKHKRHHSFERSVFRDVTNYIVNDTKPCISTGVYCRHLKNWLEYFPLRQVCFISGENLVKNPSSELEKLQDFLEIKRIVTEEYFYFNSTKGFPCLKKREASGIPHCLGNSKGRVHPNVPMKAKAALYDYYEPFNLKLYEMTRIDFNWGTRNPVKKILNREN